MYLYAVKASLYADPFIQFEKLESAADIAMRISPDKPEDLIVTIPVYKDCEILEDGETE